MSPRRSQGCGGSVNTSQELRGEVWRRGTDDWSCGSRKKLKKRGGQKKNGFVSHQIYENRAGCVKEMGEETIGGDLESLGNRSGTTLVPILADGLCSTNDVSGTVTNYGGTFGREGKRKRP